MGIYFEIPDDEFKRLTKKWTPTAPQMTKVGKHMYDLTQKRFETQGASGGVVWAPKQIPDGRAILSGRTGDLKKSWYYGGTRDQAVLASSNPYAHVHQLGTRGKGGTLATIVPRIKKALWIPLNDKAARAYHSKMFKGLKFGIDFILAKKVDIPPRPMLPVSNNEKRSIIKFFYQTIIKGMSGPVE